MIQLSPTFNARKPFLHQSLWWLLLIVCMSQSAFAETVQMVKDLNQQSSWKFRYSVSNNRVAFHFRVVNDQASTLELWRSTTDITDRVDVSAVIADPERPDLYLLLLTDKYLYVSNQDAKYWQIDVDTLNPRPVETDAPVFSDYSRSIRVPDTDEIYFLVRELNSRGVRLYKLDEGASAIRKLSDTRVAEGFEFGMSFFFRDQIVFTGRNSLWRIDKTGENPRKIATINNGSAEYAVMGRSLAYFQINNYEGDCEVWRTDGTRNGTYVLASVDIGRPDYPASPYYFGEPCDTELTLTRGNTAIFKKIDWTNRRIEIWKTMGTRATTTRLKRLAYFPPSVRVDPTNPDIDLRRVGNNIWFKIYGRDKRQVVWVSDLSLQNSRRVMVARRNVVVDLWAVEDHVLMQHVRNGANSKLFKVNADGSELSRVYAGRGYLEGVFRNDRGYSSGGAVTLGKQVLIPYKPAGGSRELLIAHDLESGQNTVRQRRSEVNESALRGNEFVTGPDNTAYFCAANGANSRWRGGWYVMQDPRRFRPRLWVTDGSGENTKPVISTIGESDQTARSCASRCGGYAVSGDRIYYTRPTTRIGEELWSAALDGSDQKPFLDLVRGRASSYPGQIAATSSGVLFTAIPYSSRRCAYPTKLFSAARDGSYRFLHEGENVEFIQQFGDRMWFRSLSADRDRAWSLLVTDGTDAGTKLVEKDALISGIAELNGETYALVGKRRSSVQGARLYRVSRNLTELEYLRKPEPGEPHQMVAHNDQLYVLQSESSYPEGVKSRLYRYDPVSLEATVISEVANVGTQSRIVSMAVLNEQIYYYVDRKGPNGNHESWEIWRTAGNPGDAVRVYAHPLGSGEPEDRFVANGVGELKVTGDSILFAAADPQSGTELWQLTLD